MNRSWLLPAFCLLTLCSCRSPLFHNQAPPGARPQPAAHSPASPLPRSSVTSVAPAHSEVQQVAYQAVGLPDSAYTGGPDFRTPNPQAAVGCDTCGPGAACAGHLGRGNACGGPWSPDGIACPWPADEYICDGGDTEVSVNVLRDWTVRGLDLEDTVAHYDTLDGRTIVEPSNRVCVYAPRFAAVRTVKGLDVHQQNQALAAANDRAMPKLSAETMLVTTKLQQQQAQGQLGLKPLNILRADQRGLPLDQVVAARGFDSGFAWHENFAVIKHGVVDNAEKARLATAATAALTWTSDQGVRVAVDGKLPIEASNNVAAEQLYRFDIPNNGRLRIIKTASTDRAKPGDIVDFTLRFDNVGDQVIGNVTIIDNLTTRLEYVEGSVQSSIDAEFFTADNDGDSLTLRWEVANPLKVGEGGIVRFQARVR